MPTKNTVKKYVEGGYYHIYNRGVEKRDIFLDDQDYKVFLYFLKIYLINPDEIKEDSRYLQNSVIERVNFQNQIELVSYCLMPNHFHLLVKQEDIDSVARFMKCLATNYVMYFNKRNERVGSLFQGIFKAILVDRDEYLVHLSRYIHMNPLGRVHKLKEYPYSSYKYYLGCNAPEWLFPQIVLNNFRRPIEYGQFVEDKKREDLNLIKDLSLD